MPSPVSAEMATEPGWRRARRAASGPTSPLLKASSSGTPSAPISSSTARTASICAFGIGAGAVDHVDQQVRFGDHLQGGSESLDQLMGQLADETHGVRQQHRLPPGQVEPAGPRVEGGEQAVLDEHPGVGQLVEEGRLAGVGVADQGDGGQPAAPAGLALEPALVGEAAQVALQAVHAPHQPAAVDLELRLAGSPGADPTGLLGQLATPAPQPGQPVAELGQLDLGLAFLGPGVLGEDVEDHGGAVDGGAAEDLFQVAGLGRGELVVEDDGVGIDRSWTAPAAPRPCPCPT